jgi:type IV secretory pathway TrbD component
VNGNLATVTILVSLLHVAALGVMIWIRVRRSEADGLDPNEQRDPRTGRAWSADMTHYRPACTAH